MLMMATMHRYPASGRVLHGTDGENGERMLQPFRANQAAMGQQPVVAQVDAEGAKYVEA